MVHVVFFFVLIVCISAVSQLEKDRLSKPYRQRLRRSLNHFIEWNMGQPPRDPSSQGLCEALVDYIQWCYFNRVNFWIPKHAVLAIRNFHPHFRSILGRPWDALKSWRNQLPLKNRLPVSLLVVKAVFGYLLNSALEDRNKAHRFITAAILFRVGFMGLLRPGEMYALRAQDVRIVVAEGSKVAVLAIVNPKNKMFMGRAQFICIRDASLVNWLEWLCANLPGQCKLWPGTQASLSELWNFTMSCLGIALVGFTLAGLRPGGTTSMYIAGKELAYIKYAGRWSNEASMACYVQEAMAALVWSKISPALEGQLIRWSSASDFAWTGPPQLPWMAFMDRKRQLRLISKSPLLWNSSRRPSSMSARSKLQAHLLPQAL